MKTVLLECGHLADVPDGYIVDGIVYCDKCPTTDSGGKTVRHIKTCPPSNPMLAVEYEEVLADHRRLVRELDMLINGVDAAPQASLCDVVCQVDKMLKSGELRRGRSTETVEGSSKPSSYRVFKTNAGTWMISDTTSVARKIAAEVVRVTAGIDTGDFCLLVDTAIDAISDRVNGALDYVAKSAPSVVESKALDESTIIRNIKALLEKWAQEDDRSWRAVQDIKDDSPHDYFRCKSAAMKAIRNRRWELETAISDAESMAHKEQPANAPGVFTVASHITAFDYVTCNSDGQMQTMDWNVPGLAVWCLAFDDFEKGDKAKITNNKTLIKA